MLKFFLLLHIHKLSTYRYFMFSSLLPEGQVGILWTFKSVKLKSLNVSCLVARKTKYFDTLLRLLFLPQDIFFIKVELIHKTLI